MTRQFAVLTKHHASEREVEHCRVSNEKTAGDIMKKLAAETFWEPAPPGEKGKVKRWRYVSVRVVPVDQA